MKINRQARRDAKSLFQACRPNGILDEAKVREVVTKVIDAKPRGYLGVLHYFQRLVKIELDRMTAVVESTVPLTPDLQGEISRNLGTRHGAGLRLSFVVNPSLLGGLRVQVGSHIYDGSVAGRLSALNESF
jgi:F-type H+-transporting ATPase subunit delta